MIEVNLHPNAAKADRRRQGLRVPRLPDWFKGRGGEPRDPWTTAAIAAPVLAVLACGAMWYFQTSSGGELEARVEVAVADSIRLADLRALSDSLTRRDKLVRERMRLVRQLDQGRFVWPHLMDEISRALPDYTWLTAIKRNAPLPDLSIELQGLAANPLAITSFVQSLQDSPYVGAVRILGSQQQLVQDVVAQSFSLVLEYTPPPPELIITEPVVPVPDGIAAALGAAPTATPPERARGEG